MMFAISISLEGIFHTPIRTMVLRGIKFVVEFIGLCVMLRRNVFDPMRLERRAVAIERGMLSLVTARIHC